MARSSASLFTRLSMAFAAFWRILVDPDFATAVHRLRRGEPFAAAAAHPPPAQPPLTQVDPGAALQLLGLLQQEGRFIDFLEEDVAAYSDTEVGAAARVVHEGCRRGLQEHLTLAPVRGEPEGARITLEEGFDSSAIRLTGNVVGRAPFRGVLTHRGWKATEVKLPKVAVGHDLTILAAAEVEL